MLVADLFPEIHMVDIIREDSFDDLKTRTSPPAEVSSPSAGKASIPPDCQQADLFRNEARSSEVNPETAAMSYVDYTVIFQVKVMPVRPIATPGGERVDRMSSRGQLADS